MFTNPKLAPHSFCKQQAPTRPEGWRLGNARYANTGRKKASPERSAVLSSRKTSARSNLEYPNLPPTLPQRPPPSQTSPTSSQEHSDAQRGGPRPFTGPRVTSLPGAGYPGRGPRGGRGAARSAQARRGRSLRAERLTIYGQSWGRAARGAALPGSARPQRQRAGQGASRPRRPGLGPPPPRTARPAPPFGPCPRLGLGPV